jgi:hypothetical protein
VRAEGSFDASGESLILVGPNKSEGMRVNSDIILQFTSRILSVHLVEMFLVVILAHNRNVNMVDNVMQLQTFLIFYFFMQNFESDNNNIIITLRRSHDDYFHRLV